MRIKVKFDVPKAYNKLDKFIKEKVQFALDTQIVKDSNYFAPMDTGNLRASGITGSFSASMTSGEASSILKSGKVESAGSGHLVWNTPYAKRLYYGIGYNFSKDSNPNARAKWFEEAKTNHMKDWQNVINRAVEKWS